MAGTVSKEGATVKSVVPLSVLRFGCHVAGSGECRRYAAVDVKSREPPVHSDTPGTAVAKSEDRPSPCINSEPVLYLVPTLLWMDDC